MAIVVWRRTGMRRRRCAGAGQVNWRPRARNRHRARHGTKARRAGGAAAQGARTRQRGGCGSSGGGVQGESFGTESLDAIFPEAHLSAPARDQRHNALAAAAGGGAGRRGALLRLCGRGGRAGAQRLALQRDPGAPRRRAHCNVQPVEPLFPLELSLRVHCRAGAADAHALPVDCRTMLTAWACPLMRQPRSVPDSEHAARRHCPAGSDRVRRRTDPAPRRTHAPGRPGTHLVAAS